MGGAYSLSKIWRFSRPTRVKIWVEARALYELPKHSSLHRTWVWGRSALFGKVARARAWAWESEAAEWRANTTVTLSASAGASRHSVNSGDTTAGNYWEHRRSSHKTVGWRRNWVSRLAWSRPHTIGLFPEQVIGEQAGRREPILCGGSEHRTRHRTDLSLIFRQKQRLKSARYDARSDVLLLACGRLKATLPPPHVGFIFHNFNVKWEPLIFRLVLNPKLHSWCSLKYTIPPNCNSFNKSWKHLLNFRFYKYGKWFNLVFL